MIDTDDDDEFGVVRLQRYRRPGLAGSLTAPFRWLRSVLAEVELNAIELMFSALVLVLFVALPIRLLGATTPEFRSLVLTVAGWAAGLVVVGIVARVLSRLVPRRREHREREAGGR